MRRAAVRLPLFHLRGGVAAPAYSLYAPKAPTKLTSSSVE